MIYKAINTPQKTRHICSYVLYIADKTRYIKRVNRNLNGTFTLYNKKIYVCLTKF